MKENAVMVGCNGSSEGRGKDLWNYTFFGGFEKREVITRLAENPVYAITLGNSDEIAKFLRK